MHNDPFLIRVLVITNAHRLEPIAAPTPDEAHVHVSRYLAIDLVFARRRRPAHWRGLTRDIGHSPGNNIRNRPDRSRLTRLPPRQKHDGAVTSVPFARHQIPLEAESRARDFLRDTMPHLAERPFSFARICWDADTPDRAFLIDRHPEYASLVVAVGGSGNGAMQMPAIGGFIVDALEGRLSSEVEMAVGRDWSSPQGRHGGPERAMDFQDLKEDGWTYIHDAQ